MNKSRQRQSKTAAPKQPDPPPMEVDTNDDELHLSEDEEGGTRVGDIYIPPPVEPHCSSVSKGLPRLIITNIIIENFKSYAGKVVLGPFDHCFSAVIGPNGSGKSNVIDSMLFVFGYRAQKLRSKKLSVVLHKSSAFPNINSATVAVYFKQIVDKENNVIEHIENTDLVVSRTVFKDNSSHYSIDGKKVHFKEVAKLLKGHGIDLDHNRFLILQGEVESIAMMKPTGKTDNECGLLEYLEDIIGTARYKQPLIKINDRVEILNEERTEKSNRCKIAEREMKDLENPKNEAVQYIKLENELEKNKNLNIQKNILMTNRLINELSTDLEASSGVLKKHDEEMKLLVEERVEKEGIIQAENQKNESLRKEKDTCDQSIKNTENLQVNIQALLESSNKERKQFAVQVKKETEKLEELKKLPEKNSLEITECEKKVTKMTKQKTDLENTLAENLLTLQDETKPLIDKKENLQTKLIDLKKCVDESKAELDIATSELSICNHDEMSERGKLDAMKHSITDSYQSLNEKKEKLENLNGEIPAINTQMIESQEKLKVLQKEEVELTSKIGNLRGNIEETVRTMQQTKSRGHVLDSLMKEKNSGKIPGILGRLGDLGGIDDKYDVAISTACGRLDNIIVDTVNTAQACIEHLKKYDVGRASFVALEKVAYLHAQSQQRINIPENVPRLFDLVRVEDNRVLAAFYFALRDTLVSNDLEQGTRIAYGAKRFRVVTLNGDLIETSGTMSGGGKNKCRGRMGQQVTTKTSAVATPRSNKDVEVLQRQAQELQNQLNYNQQQQGELENQIELLRNSLRIKNADVKKLTMELKSLSNQIPKIQEQVDRQQEKADKTRTDPAKVRELEAKINEKKIEFEKSTKAAEKITTQVDQITKQINDITGSKVKDIQTKVASLTKQIDKLTANINKLNVEITTSARNVKKSEDKIVNMQAEIKTAENCILENADKRKECVEKIAELKTRFDELIDELKEAQSGCSEIVKQIAEIEKKENQRKLKRLELVQMFQLVEKKLSDEKNLLPRLKNKLNPLKLRKLPDEELEVLKTYTEQELDTYTIDAIDFTKTSIEEQLGTNKPNLGVIEEFLEKTKVYIQRVNVLEDITKKRNEMKELYEKVRKNRYNEFMNGFHIITKKLKEMYQMITLGGDAELELVDSMNPFLEGIVFSVRPPKKSWKMISNLSGGEKTLSSLALVFALHYYKPSPLYVMDEIDAALDFKNVSIVAYYIRERTKNAQFIIISLRSNMFELSDTLVGIYKVSDCTQQCTIKNNTAEGQHQKNIATQRSRISQTQEAPDYTLNDTFLRPSQPVRQSRRPLSIINGSIESNDSLLGSLDNTIDTSINQIPEMITDAAQISDNQLVEAEQEEEVEEENEVPVVSRVEDQGDAMDVSGTESDGSPDMDTSIDEPPVVMVVTAEMHSGN